jgi:hypothetical protein
MEQYPAHETNPQPRSSGNIPLVLSAVALAASLIALLITLTSNPLGKGIDNYDFSTPEAALKSMMQIEADRAILAQLDLKFLQKGKELDEAVRTFEIHRTVDFKDKKVIFFSYLKKGEKEKEIMGLEKNLESKMWFREYVSVYDVKKTNEQLAKEMEAWEEDED